MQSSPLLSLSPEKLESEVQRKWAVLLCVPPCPHQLPAPHRGRAETHHWVRRRRPVSHFGGPGLEYPRTLFPVWLFSPASTCAQMHILFWGTLKVLDLAEGKARSWQHWQTQQFNTPHLQGEQKLTSFFMGPSSPMHFPRISKCYGIFIATPQTTSILDLSRHMHCHEH